jgi:predicted RNA-binding protein with PIN domain
VPFLIDGYNLLHAMGRLGGPVGPHGLAKARAGLLGLLAVAHGRHPGEATVVFDARDPPPGADPVAVVNAVHVVFAVGQEADDCIEQLIAHDPAPKRLVVVSDDRRLARAARRRGCTSWGCDQYVRWLHRRRAAGTAPAPPGGDKPPTVSPEEAARWEARFGDVQADPEFKDLFDDLGTAGLDGAGPETIS